VVTVLHHTGLSCCLCHALADARVVLLSITKLKPLLPVWQCYACLFCTDTRLTAACGAMHKQHTQHLYIPGPNSTWYCQHVVTGPLKIALIADAGM